VMELSALLHFPRGFICLIAQGEKVLAHKEVTSVSTELLDHLDRLTFVASLNCANFHGFSLCISRNDLQFSADLFVAPTVGEEEEEKSRRNPKIRKTSEAKKPQQRLRVKIKVGKSREKCAGRMEIKVLILKFLLLLLP
jgi:hypothetical protein